MKFKNRMKRVMVGLLTLCMVLSFLPVDVLAEELETVAAEREAIRQTIAASVDAEEYPKGMFDFLTARMETSEDMNSVEFAIVRRGNTDEAASVTFKIIDMTAEYGVDYTLKVSGTFFDTTLKKETDSETLLQATLDEAEAVYIGAQDETVEPDGSSSDVQDEETNPDGATLDTTEIESEDTEEAAEPDDNHNNEVTESNGESSAEIQLGSDLQSARTALTGVASDSTTWREADEDDINVLVDAYNDMYAELDGIEYTLNFAEGEYMKTFKFVTIDDDISEDEEQVLFVLCNAENCAVSENPTGFMNIVDNEDPEEITFGFASDVVTVDTDSYEAQIVVERLTGLYRYGTVVLSTAEQTAVEGVHYDSFIEEIAFVPGQQYQTITIPIKSHDAFEDLYFKVYIDGTSTSMDVVIRHEDIVGETERAYLSRSISSDNLFSESSTMLSSSSDNSEIWCRSEDITLTKSWGSGNQNDSTFTFNDGNGYLGCRLDLSMIAKMTFYSENPNAGTYVSKKAGWSYKCNAIINTKSGRQVYHQGKYTATSDTVILNDTDRAGGYVYFTAGTWHTCKNSNPIFSRTVNVTYIPVEIKIGAYDDDAMIQPKIYTSPTSCTNNGKSFLAGKLKFEGESAGTTSKFFYNEDRVSFEETARQEEDSTYLWGIKFECKSGSTTSYFYYEGTSFSIKDLYCGNLKDSITGKAIGATAKLSDTINGETFTCYKVYPVYRQKTAFTTIKIDETKSQFATGTFKNEQTIKTGLMDKIKIEIAGTGGWAVSGFNLAVGNRAAAKITSAEQERELYSMTTSDGNSTYKTWSPIYKSDSNWIQSTINTDAAIPGSLLYQPTKSNNTLEALYEKTSITVTVNPRANSILAQQQGYVAYAGEDGNAQVAKYTGTDSDGLLRGTTISVTPYAVGNTYQFIGGFYDSTETGYKFLWQDFTGDTDGDGKLSAEEIKALGSSYSLINKGVYAGDIFNYVPSISVGPVLYYHIVEKSEKDTEFSNTLSGNVYLKSCSVIENGNSALSYTTTPLSGATITAGGYTTTTDENGYWEITSSSFDTGEIYTATLLYGGRSYTADVTVNRSATDFVIDAYNTFNVTDFKAYRVTNDSDYENVEDWNLHKIDNAAISNEDKRHLYTFKIEELVPTTAVVGSVEVNRYSSGGILKATYTAVYDEDNKRWEVKDPDLLEAYGDDSDSYNYSFNPATEAIVAGDYLTVRIYDQYGIGYIEHEVGFVYKPKLSVINIVNSFESPVNNVIDFIGDVDMTFDLGLTARMDALDNTLTDTVENKLTVTTTEDSRTISWGWNKDFKKSYDSEKNNKKNDKTEDSKKDPESSEAPTTAAEAIKEEAKKLEDASDEAGKDNEAKDAATETAKEAVDTDSKDNEKSSKVTADLKVKLSVAVELVMGYDTETNRYYFQDFVVTGVVSGEAGSKYEYTTPIGIVIFVEGKLSGDITAMLAIEPYYDNPAEPEYLYMDESGTIDLTSIGNSDVDRQLSIYGKLMVRPKVTLSVGASVLSDKVASVSLTGAADFDMVFTTAGDGAGNVSLSADLTLSILGGLVEKKWLIAKETYDMFSYNSGTVARLMSVNDDYRYDAITDEDTDQKLYLQNRGGWNENGGISLLSTGTETYNEVVLQTGAYPYAYPQIFELYSGDEYDYTGATAQQLLLFLDADSEKVCLMYSIYQDSGDGRGYTWTQPAPVDADTAGDDTPQVEDLGDKLFIMWSSQPKDLGETDAVSVLNSRNIKSVFFDKTTKTFSDVQYITNTTDADSTADDYASASYYVDGDGKEHLMVTYIKTQYVQTGDSLVVGDLLEPYSTIAYRFYDFENHAWVDDYSGETGTNVVNLLSAEQLEALTDNWYGQGFVDLSTYVMVDETNLLLTESSTDSDGNSLAQYVGLWSRKPDSGEISLASLDSDPMVVEHETMNCGKYAVSAYLVDLGKTSSDTTDREIFLQLYDFEEGTFYPAIRLTNDSHTQEDLELMETLEGVMLYYISNGNIIQKNISDMVENMLSLTLGNGTEVLVENKVYGVYSGEEIILEAGEDSPYTEYIVNTDGFNVYLTWTESSISVRDGIDLNSSEATEPENYFVERHIYMAMETFDVYTGEDGDSGQEYSYVSSWTKPVQMTDEQGANFSDIDCLMIGNGVLRCVYLKGMSEITEVGGEELPAENVNNRSLISADFDFNVERYTISIDNTDEIASDQENEAVQITVKNESILPMEGIGVTLEISQNGTVYSTEETTIETLVGGDSETTILLIDTPEEFEETTITAKVMHYGYKYASTSEELSPDTLIEITDLYHEMVDRNTAQFTVTVMNTGADNAEDERVYLNCNGNVFKSEAFDLISGSTTSVTFTAEIDEEAFEESRNETTITETATMKVYTTGSIETYSIIRTASVELEDQLRRITLVDENGKHYSNSITLSPGALLLLSVDNGEDALNRPQISLVSDDETVISVVNGVLTAEQQGTATVQVEIYPAIDIYETTEEGTMRLISSYNTLPSCLILTRELTINTGYGGEEDCPSAAFDDLDTTLWYHEATDYVLTRKIMQGYSGKFGPDDSLTRSMMAQILYNMAGQPEVSGTMDFIDVAEGSWYYDAVLWAFQKNIILGYGNGTFGPEDSITREQLAVMIWRYLGSPGATQTELDFKDAKDASDWAMDALLWANENSVVNGDENHYLLPTGEATRAQAAEVIKNYWASETES